MKKIKLIALFGPAGAGKDFILERWAGRGGLHIVVNHSTRPQRENEKEGDPYYFISDDKYAEMVDNKEFIQTTVFNNWYYGTAFSELKEDKVNIGVFNIAAIEQLLTDDRIDVLPVAIIAKDKIRLIRQLNRECEPDCTEICRRFLADKKDYEVISFKYLTYANGNGVSLNHLFDALEIILTEWQNLLIIQQES